MDVWISYPGTLHDQFLKNGELNLEDYVNDA